jgi:methionine-rich copper-binding protein CopC
MNDPNHRRRRGLVVLIVCCVLTPAVALAHAVLVESSPRQDQTLTAATTRAVLRFNARIEKKVTRVNLVDANGRKMKLPPLPDDADGPEDRLIIALPATLPPGSYRLEYTVLAADGHSSPGVLRFTLGGGAATATAPTSAPAGAAR